MDGRLSTELVSGLIIEVGHSLHQTSPDSWNRRIFTKKDLIAGNRDTLKEDQKAINY